ncbi:hypothetical protein D3C76_1146190 [compost metagenome]
MGPQCLDGHIDSPTIGQGHDLLDHVTVLEVDDMGRAQPSRNVHPLNHGIDANDCRRAFKACTCDRTEAYWPKGKHGNRIADGHFAPFCPGKTGGHDVRAHQHLLVTEPVGNRAQIGKGVRYQHVLGLAAVDDVAELPAPDSAKTMARVWSIL